MTETAGDAGSFMLGNTLGPTAGAESGWFEPLGVGGSFVLIGEGGLFDLVSVFTLTDSFAWVFSGVFSGSLGSSHSVLTSVRAVEGPLSIWSPFSFSESSELAEASVLLLPLEAVLSMLLTVLVRFITDLPV